MLVLLLVIFLIFRNPDKSLEELKVIYTDAESEWTEIMDMEVHYKQEGSGHPLILLHGTGASLHTWDGWVDYFDDQLTTYRMDLPAFGLTGPHPDKDYTIESYVRFVDAFAKAKQLDTFAIAGNSLGGYIAWMYAVEHPQKVSHLILLDAAGYPQKGASNALAFKIANNPLLRPIMKQITPKSFIEKNLVQVYADDDKITDALINRYHDMALRSGNRQAFIDRVHTVHQDNSGRITEIKCPTLIQWGSEDTWVAPINGERFKEDIPHAELVYYENAGHTPMEEIPNRTAIDALRFIDNN